MRARLAHALERTSSKLDRLLGRIEGREPDARWDPTRVRREDVVWAYRVMLGREPEDESTIASLLDTCGTVHELRQHFFRSVEFRRTYVQHSVTDASSVVCKDMPGGFRMFLDLADATAWDMLLGTYEPEELEFVRRHVEPGWTALDLGAHIGIFALTMCARVGDEGSVHAFEPVPRHADLLERSAAENGWSSRLVVHRACVADTSGSADFAVRRDGVDLWGSHLVGSTTPEPWMETDRVPLVILDDLELPRPVRFVKVDVEGAEPLCARGARRILAEDRPLVLSEFHPEQLRKISGRDPSDYVETMQRLGYTCHRLQGADIGEPIGDPAAGGFATVVFVPD